MRIAIVNDLLMAVEALRRVVSSVPGYQVCWIARDGAEAVRKCLTDRPDLILMDMQMPVMDGAEATRRIMRECPTAILVVSSTLGGNFSKVFEAMGHGAVDAVKTPELGKDDSVQGGAPLLAKIEAIERSKDSFERSAQIKSGLLRPDAARSKEELPTLPLIAIGASTGGPNALVEVLNHIPKDLRAGIVIAQHITADFAPGLASWLAETCQRPVRIACNNDQPQAGVVLIAGTNDHLAMIPGGTLRYTPEPVDTSYRPSVDVLFSTCAAHWKRPGVAALLTGMGRDGAKGLLTLKEKGWHTIAQDEKTSIVYGMPAAAAEKGAAQQILPLHEIGEAITHHIGKLWRPVTPRP
ncbi:MAG: chemotaxis response regulator protein-glutamate methylesterase [Planctomycetaceae bacterium]